MTKATEKIRSIAEVLMEDIGYDEATDGYKQECRINAELALEGIERWNLGYRGSLMDTGGFGSSYRGLVANESADVPELTHTILWRVVWTEGDEWLTYANIDYPYLRPVVELDEDTDPVRLEVTVGATTRNAAIVMAKGHFERLFNWKEPESQVYRVRYSHIDDYAISVDRTAEPGEVATSRDASGNWTYFATVKTTTKERARRIAVDMWIGTFPDQWRA